MSGATLHGRAGCAITGAMLSPCGAIVNRHDPDRFLTALFAPPARREALFTLYAFNHELARAREATSEPTLALIRLHWWREVVEGARRRHEVASPLAEALAAGALAAPDLLALIDAREAEAEAEPAFATLADWRAYLFATAGGLAVAAARALGAAAPGSFRPLGAAYGAAGVLRSVAAHAGQRRCLLPLDRLGAQGLTADSVIADPQAAALAPVRAALAAEGAAWLAEGPRRLPRPIVAAALPAVLAARDLRRPGGHGPRGLGDRLAVTWSGLTGWLLT